MISFVTFARSLTAVSGTSLCRKCVIAPRRNGCGLTLEGHLEEESNPTASQSLSSRSCGHSCPYLHGGLTRHGPSRSPSIDGYSCRRCSGSIRTGSPRHRRLRRPCRQFGLGQCVEGIESGEGGNVEGCGVAGDHPGLPRAAGGGDQQDFCWQPIILTSG